MIQNTNVQTKDVSQSNNEDSTSDSVSYQSNLKEEARADDSSNSIVERLIILREWLERNKVFFETIIAVIISGITIFVAIKTNSIEKDQKEIAKQKALPFIDVASEYDEDGNVIRVDIVNSGGLLDAIDIQVYPYVNYELIMGHRSYTKSVECFPIEFRNNRTKREPYRLLSPHTKVGILFSIWGSDVEDYVRTITDREPSETCQIYHLGNNNKPQEEQSESAMTYVVESMSFEYLLKIEYSDTVEHEMRTDFFRVKTGVGYGNNLNTGVSEIDWDSNENPNLEGVLEGKGIITIPYNPKKIDADNDLRSLQKQLINASVERRAEDSVSE